MIIETMLFYINLRVSLARTWQEGQQPLKISWLDWFDSHNYWLNRLAPDVVDGVMIGSESSSDKWVHFQSSRYDNVKKLQATVLKRQVFIFHSSHNGVMSLEIL